MPPAGSELPAAARRLFHEPPAPLDPAAPDPHVVGRLLEDGDSAELAWLCRQIPRATLARWVERHGPRRLSRRSLAFWRLLLDLPPASPEQLAELARRRELWPL